MNIALVIGNAWIDAALRRLIWNFAYWMFLWGIQECFHVPLSPPISNRPSTPSHHLTMRLFLLSMLVSYSYLICFFANYMLYWYLDHTCSYSGCKNVLVIDGNMKNRRDVCAATEAGYTEYNGLPGVIKTGCQLTPSFQSKFCYEYSLRVGKITPVEDGQQVALPEENIVGIIASKKQTRRGIYYQVL